MFGQKQSFVDKNIRTTNNGYVARSLGSDIKNKALEMRATGATLGEISNKLGVSKSTVLVWIKDIKLNDAAKERIAGLRIQARQKGSRTIKLKHFTMLEKVLEESRKTLQVFDIKNPNVCKIICSLLYWGEGGKVDKNLSFVNSDPKMINVFISLLRRAFEIDERKLRCLVHVHEYHDELEIKNYWSKITNIPILQFHKSYLKPHTGKVVRENFKGTIRISYYDVRIAHELKAIYNALTESIGT